MQDWSSLPNRPRLVGGSVDFTPALPCRAWDYSTATVGGRMTAASGIPAAFLVRTDHLLSLPLRILETEWEALTDLVGYGQRAEALTWYPDASDSGTSFGVYLESPEAGAGLSPVRSAEYPRVLEVTLTLRRASGAPWDLDFFGGTQES